jgi:hypothetical protein
MDGWLAACGGIQKGYPKELMDAEHSLGLEAMHFANETVRTLE